jgi:hypothetical protein
MKRIIVSLAGLAAEFSSAAADAHAFLDHAVPAVGSTVTSAPKDVRIFYTQPIEPAFSGATVSGPGGQDIATGAAAVDPRNPMELVLTLPPIAPGHYKVTWHVVSVDTHRTSGTFSFDIQP